MYSYKLKLCICIILLANIAFCQNTLSGKVVDNNNKEIAYADLILKESENSKIVFHTQSNLVGDYLINYKPGKYTLECSILGYESTSQEMVLGEKPQVLNISLTESKVNLDQVTVSAHKITLERKIDRLVMNIKNAITNTGSSVLEVLEKSPGITINQQSGSISMAGKEGVVVMINGKQQYLKNQALIQFLAGLNAQSVDKIELINTPPAGFDAEGAAGFINIQLLKAENDGTKSDLAMTFGTYMGHLGKLDYGLHFNKGRFNTSVLISSSINNQTQEFNFYRDLNIDGKKLTTHAFNDRHPTIFNNNVLLNAGYTSGKHHLNFNLNGYRNNWYLKSYNQTSNKILSSLQDSAYTRITETNRWSHFGANVSYQYQINSKNSIKVQYDKLFYNTYNPSHYYNTFFKPNERSTNEIAIDKTTPIHINVVKADFTSTLSKKVKWEFGVKLTNSMLYNKVGASILTNNQWEVNNNYTQDAKLNESIYGVYQSMDWNISNKLITKAGIRYEYSTTKILNTDNTVVVDRYLGRLFPSLNLSYYIDNKSSIGLSFSSRVNRPTFNDLAPFVFINDPNSFTTGNTNLQPTISNSIKADYKIKSFLISLQQSFDKNILAIFTPKYDQSLNATIYQTRNFENSKTTSLTLSNFFTITKNWNSIVNLTAAYGKINGIYEERQIQITRTNATIMYINNFALSPKFSLELASMFNSGGFLGAYVVKPFGFMNIGLRKKLPNGNTISLNGNNVLNTMPMRFSFTDPYLNNTYSLKMYFSRPQVSISYKHSFGNNKVKAGNTNITSEERARINN